MILHTQDRPFKCSLCDEYFKSRFARLKHQEKFHLGNRVPPHLQLVQRCLHVNQVILGCGWPAQVTWLLCTLAS